MMTISVGTITGDKREAVTTTTARDEATSDRIVKIVQIPTVKMRAQAIRERQ